MKHPYFELTPEQQKAAQLKFACFFLMFNLTVGTLLFFMGMGGLVLLVFALALSIYAPFLDVPSGIKAGNLNYFSPMLIGEKVKDGKLVLHGGSLFDYYFLLDKFDCPLAKKKQTYLMLIDGMLNLITQHENNIPTNITIKATSYVLNHRTAHKLGLQSASPDWFRRLILYYNFFNLTCCLSLLNSKLTWPNVHRVQSFQGELDALIAKKPQLLSLRKRLTRQPK